MSQFYENKATLCIHFCALYTHTGTDMTADVDDDVHLPGLIYARRALAFLVTSLKYRISWTLK